MIIIYPDNTDFHQPSALFSYPCEYFSLYQRFLCFFNYTYLFNSCQAQIKKILKKLHLTRIIFNYTIINKFYIYSLTETDIYVEAYRELSFGER